MQDELQSLLSDSQASHLGNVVLRNEIRSSLGPFRTLPDYKIRYPQVITDALGQLYVQYNSAFSDLMAANREWETDYRFCLLGDTFTNLIVRIDMVGLPQSFLDAAAALPVDVVREVLRRRIFEFENAPGMYQLQEKIFNPNWKDPSFFCRNFRSTLQSLRKKHGKPIALLAVTTEKYLAMKATEFGKEVDEPLSDTEVKQLSGFDRFFGPDEFRQHVEENGGECQYVLCARTSDPVERLYDPTLQIRHPLLSDPRMRQIIKAHSLTLNVDDPAWPVGDARRINDTKAYMPPMGMGFVVRGEEDLYSGDFLTYMLEGKGEKRGKGRGIFEPGRKRVSSGLSSYLAVQGLDPESATLRCKPLLGAHGCYGHLVGSLVVQEFRSKLRRNMNRRGPYVIQPEIPIPTITNFTERTEYTYIDRVWFTMATGQSQFLGGFRSMILSSSVESQKGRNHGNGETVWSEIIG